MEIAGFISYGFNKCLHFSEHVDVYDIDGNHIAKKTIEEVYKNRNDNMYVLSRNEKTKKNILIKITNVHDTGEVPVCEFVLDNGQKVRCSTKHKFRSKDGRMLPIWTIMKEKLDIITDFDKITNSVKIMSYKDLGEQQTYDIEVEHIDHQYYLSNGLLSSNSHSVAYAFNSYSCAWLYTYYEHEWIKTCLELSNDFEATVNTIKLLGYKILKPDVTKSLTDEWIVNKDKTCIPSLMSLKGIGQTAAEELVLKRNHKEFKSLNDFFFDENSIWKWSKLNKKTLDILIKAEAFSSFECVGEDKTFKNYRHLYNSMFDDDNFERIKKRKKTIEECSLAASSEDWLTTEKLSIQKNIFEFYDKTLILTDFNKMFEEFENIRGKITVIWFCLKCDTEK
jgi:hypothetical protein